MSVTLHEKTMHIVLDINLRYMPQLSPGVIITDFCFLAWIDRGIIPLHKCLLRSFQNAILTELWFEEVSHVTTQSIHDMELLWLDKHGTCTQKSYQPLLSSTLCVKSFRNVSLLFLSTEMLAAALVLTLWQPLSPLTLWVGPRIFNKR